MKKNNNVLIVFVLIVFSILNFCKNYFLNGNFSFNIIAELLLFIFIFFLSNYKFKKYEFYSKFTNYMLIIFSILSFIFSSFSGLSYLLLYLFLILITVTYMTFTKNKFEVSMVMSTSYFLLIMVIFACLNLLKFTEFFLVIISVLCIFYLYKNKLKLQETIEKINKTSFIIFFALFIVAILGGAGRYIHKWDEYSYWAYAAKVGIEEKSIYAVISKLGATRGYPPISTIWHYVVSIFCGGFSEPNLYIGLSILTFIYFMPIFEKIKNYKKSIQSLFVISIIFFPYLFNGSISYSLIYVDLLLSLMCTSAIIIADSESNYKTAIKKILIILLTITLLKVNGFVFAFTIILLLYLKDLMNSRVSIKNIFINMKKYIIPGVIVIFSFCIWKILSELSILPNLAYDFKLVPDSLETNIVAKLNPKFLLDFCTKVMNSFDESIVYSFINIPLFAYLIAIFSIIYYTERKKSNKNVFRILLPYVLSYIVFYLITALSLFVMFSVYEASTLASFGRYLAPINIAYSIYAINNLISLKENKLTVIICLIIISLVGFANVTFFVTDIKDRRETQHVSQARQDTFNDINAKTKKSSKVFVINQEDNDTIMPLWYARYYCYPRIINVHPFAITWKIKTESNEWDLKDWGLTKETFEQHLIDQKFDYVFFYSSTEELENELSSMIDDKNNFKKYKLFKIYKSNDSLKLKPVS